MSDLVERLRECSGDWPACLVKLDNEAADEIERLRSQVAAIRNETIEECVKECQGNLSKGSKVAYFYEDVGVNKCIDSIRALKTAPTED